MTPSPEQRFTDKHLSKWKYALQSVWALKFKRNEVEGIIARMEAHEAMSDYLAHEDHCIRNRYEAGEPTADGGYRMKYAGKWYQSRPIDETPKCNCGLDEKFEAWRQVAGK